MTQGKVACSWSQSDWVRTRALLILEPRFLEMPGLLVSGASLGPYAHSGLLAHVHYTEIPLPFLDLSKSYPKVCENER